MSTTAHIGASVYIKGQITAKEPLTVSGRVDGTVQVDGHPLTILAGAQINAATIVAHEVVIAGHVVGKVDATGRIVVRDTAQVEGDLTAPTISVAEGATIKGRVQTTERRKASLQLAS